MLYGEKIKNDSVYLKKYIVIVKYTNMSYSVCAKKIIIKTTVKKLFQNKHDVVQNWS